MRADPGRMIPVEGSAPVPRRRLRSLDAFRGAVLALMLLTPATGPPEHFPFLRHAAWEGATASDLILPTFLVTSGLSLAFLLRPPTATSVRWRLARRLVALVAIGLVYNAYGTTGFDLADLRFTGVLQLIGISGFVAAVVVLGSRRSDGTDRTGVIVAAAGGLPALYGAGLVVLSERCPGTEPCSPYAGLDVTVLGEATWPPLVSCSSDTWPVGSCAGSRIRWAPPWSAGSSVPGSRRSAWRPSSIGSNR